MSTESGSVNVQRVEARSPQRSRFVSTLKRLLKLPKAKDVENGNGQTRLASDIPTKTPRFAAISTASLDTSSIDSLSRDSNGGNDYLIFRSPFGSRKACERQPFVRGTGAFSNDRPLSGSKATLQHSHSGPCENMSTNSQPLGSDDGRGRHALQPPQSNNRARLGSAVVRGPWGQTPARSETALPPLLSSHSSDARSESSSAPPETIPSETKQRGSGSEADKRGSVAPQEPQPASNSGAVLAPDASAPAPSPPEPAPSRTLLLAMCPGAPVAMQRPRWSLEDYDVSCQIYKSATSAVYKATCRRSGLPVALKVYFLSRVPANVVHMIVREIKIHVDLTHKNIIMLYGVFQDEKMLVLVQEFAARGDLYGIHRAMNHRMSETQLTELVLAPFLSGLTYLHARGFCHRDIKPENILFTQDWRLVIADFGVSIDLNQERAVTRAGTLEYMAPEVERCPIKSLPEENKEKESLAYTTAVDIWAVGVLAYELLVGFPPFVADAPAAAAHGAGAAFLAANATCKTLSFPASTSANARDFISKALADRPEERPTAHELSRHPWLAPSAVQSAAAGHRVPMRRSSGQLSSSGQGPLIPSRLGSASLASGPSSAVVHAVTAAAPPPVVVQQ